MSQATFTFRANGELNDIVHRQKEVEDRGAWFREQVRAGLDSANAGNLVSNEDVEAKFAARRAETRRKVVKSL